MELTDLIARLVEARPDLKERMPRKCDCGMCSLWVPPKGYEGDGFGEESATLIVQGIVAEELGRNGWCICRVTPPDHWMLSDAWYNPKSAMRPSPWLGTAPTYLEAATRALCEIERKA